MMDLIWINRTLGGVMTNGTIAIAMGARHEDADSAESLIYQALDHLQAAGWRAPPPGASGMISRALANMRAAGEPMERIRAGETIGLIVHRLELALRAGGAAGEQAVTALRRELERLAAEWIGGTTIWR